MQEGTMAGCGYGLGTGLMGSMFTHLMSLFGITFILLCV
jgi:hypothetical protein